MASHAKGPTTTAVQTLKLIRDGQEFTEIQEGLGRILIPVAAKSGKQKKAQSEEDHQNVFYNPIQQFNRDLTVLVIKAHGEEAIAKKLAIIQAKVNKKKRKRTAADDSRPHKQEKLQASTDGELAPKAATADEQGLSEDRSNVTGSTDAVEASAAESSKAVDPETEPATTAAEPSGQVKDNDTSSRPGNNREPRKLDPPKFTILDALSATGLRALRYVQELPFVTSVTANDLIPSAVEAIKRNVEHNDVASKINVTQSDARAHMYSLIADEITQENTRNPLHFRQTSNANSNKYDVIDLDPYGTAATFFDAAVHAVRDDGGLLCVTCTDSGVWATHGYAEKAFALYGGVSLKGYYSHEAGLRLVLNGIATTAARHGLTIEPLLSLSIDYYLRIFVRIRKSPISVKYLPGKTMLVYSCDQGCGAWETQLLMRNKKSPNKKGSGFFYKHGLSLAPTADQFCKHCGTKTHLAGPMYAGPLHSPEFIQRVLDDLPNASKDIYGTTTRIEGMLRTALEESALTPAPDSERSIDEDEYAAVEPYPFFFHPTILAGSMQCTCPDEDSVRGALRGLGYETTRSHCKPGSLKTNAPWSVIWHIMREWVRQKAPVRVDNIKPGTPTHRLLRLDRKDAASEPDHTSTKSNEVDNLEVVFNKALGQDKSSKKGLVRYQMNPKENWGPQSKAKAG